MAPSDWFQTKTLPRIASVDTVRRSKVRLDPWAELDGPCFYYSRPQSIKLTGPITSKILKNSREINRGSSSDTLSIATDFEITSNTANGELKTGLVGLGDSFGSLRFTSASLARRSCSLGSHGDTQKFEFAGKDLDENEDVDSNRTMASL
ncbi:putative histone H2AXa [Senna tora]|uniref:Putative histone H2AXa n=1 Tax=Senna tora TaxID=362788 RepID=A0A834TAJ2_9FABA|nr:putative histone H2AXa [Senna tora]